MPLVYNRGSHGPGWLTPGHAVTNESTRHLSNRNLNEEEGRAESMLGVTWDCLPDFLGESKQRGSVSLGVQT